MMRLKSQEFLVALLSIFMFILMISSFSTLKVFSQSKITIEDITTQVNTYYKNGQIYGSGANEIVYDLKTELDVAIDTRDKGRTSVVCSKLKAFANKVEAKRNEQPNGIEASTADNLINMASGISENYCEGRATPELATTVQPTAMPTETVVLPSNECITHQGCFTVEFQGYETINDQVRLTFKVTNHCEWNVGYVALGTNDWIRLTPTDDDTYSSGLGDYRVEWTNEHEPLGFHSVKFSTRFEGFDKNKSDSFHIFVKESHSNTTVQVKVQAGLQQERFSFDLTENTCVPPLTLSLPT